MKNPLNFRPVTTPRTDTDWVSNGEVLPFPCTWAMVNAGGGGGGMIVKSIEVVVVLACASLTVTGSETGPVGANAGTKYSNENVPSPAVASPLVPSSTSETMLPSICAVTARPVLVGFRPRTVLTVRRVDAP